MRWIEKRLTSFRIVRTFSISMLCLGEIELRAPAVGAKIGVFYVTHGLTVRGGHSSSKYCVTGYGSILKRFSAISSEAIALSGSLQWFPFTLPGGATIFAKLPSKFTKSPKIGGKVYAHNFV